MDRARGSSRFKDLCGKALGGCEVSRKKCLIGTASGTSVTSSQERPGTGYAAVALVDDQSDDRPPPSNDRSNSPSWLHWRRCGKWAFDADMEDTVRGGSLSPKAKVGEQMADGRNAGYMLTKIFRKSVSDPEPVGP